MSSSESKPYYCMSLVIEASACLGSACVKWVPQSGDAGYTGAPMYEGGDNYPITGLGWCADNLRRAPFADAAGGEE
jgi:hypothetical protein